MIFDDRGMPWTIRLSLGWTIVLALCCAGALFLPLGIYLAYWVRTRQGRSVAFWCYLILTAILILVALLPLNVFDRSPVAAAVLTAFAVGVFALLFAAPLVLRAELRSLYQGTWGISLPINIFLTILFSSLYLNYSVPDLPVAPSSDAVPKQV
jgi:branched-subunit amino acid ABC-type transport system permease component